MTKPHTIPIILMADDDPDDRMLARDAMRDANLPAEMKFVEDGEKLLEYLFRLGDYANAPRPRLILLDLNMPKKSGREALKDIKSNPQFRAIPIVVLTTSKAEADVLRSYDLGVNSYITKPVTFDSLVDLMKTLNEYWFQKVQLPSQEADPS